MVIDAPVPPSHQVTRLLVDWRNGDQGAPDPSRPRRASPRRSPSGSSVVPPPYIFDTTRPWTEQKPRMLPVFEPPNGLFVVNSWSPDGERIAGTAGLDEKGLVVYSVRTNRYERLTDFGECPVWLPDSRRLLFVSRGKEFYIIDTQTKQTRKIYSSTRDVPGPPQLSDDGRTIYFGRPVTESDIWTRTLK